MIVSTFNIQNNYNKYDNNKSSIIYNYLIDNNIDILGLQEVFSKCHDDLVCKLDNEYGIEGKYRFRSRFILKKINEQTPIISKYKIISHKTYYLPHLPSPLKRIMTHIIIDYHGKKISIYNTHLEYRLQSVKKRQLKKISKILKYDKNPKILMGDFNLKNNNPLFNNFEKSLKEINMNRIHLNHKTFKPSKYKREIDHIFISDCFSIDSQKVKEDVDISDHYPVIIEIKMNGLEKS